MRHAQACKIIICSASANAHTRLQIIGQASALPAVLAPMPMSLSTVYKH